LDEARLRTSSNSVDFDNATAASTTGATSAAGTPTSAAAASAAAAAATSSAAVAAAPMPLRGVPAGLKVLVNFRATGSAPIMKKTKFTLSASHRFGMVIEWLRKTLHLKVADPLFVFCNQAFAPNPDSSMYDLFQCYQVQNELVINYAVQEAWG
jgi:ubiquitin-like protein ATG12